MKDDGSGETAQPLQPAALFARWSAVLAAGLGCLALAVVVATFPLGSMTGQLSPQSVASTLVALAFAVVGLLVALRRHLPLGAVALVLQPSWAPGIVSFGLAVLLF